MEQKDQDKTETQIDKKTQAEVRAVWLLRRCQKSRKPGSYLFLCEAIGIREEGVALINKTQRI